MKKLFIAFIIALMLIIGSASAAILQPTDDFYVLDDANVLDIDTEGLIVFSNDVLFADCGAQFVVVVTDSLGGEDIADYAYNLYNDWAIGNKDGEGMLMLLVTGEEKYHLLCGEGLSDDFSAGTLRSLCKVYIEPDFDKGDYDAAVDKAFRFIFGKIADACGSNATVEDGLRLYEAYMAGDDEPIYDYDDDRNSGIAAGFIDDQSREEPRNGGISIGLIIVIVIIILIIASRKRAATRARTRTNVVNQVIPPIINVINTNTRPRTNMPPPPHSPNHGRFGGHTGGIFGSSRPASDRRSADRPTFGSAPRSTGSRTTFGSSNRSSGSRSSFGSSRSTSSFGGSRSGGASRSPSRSGFGGGRSGGGGHSRGGGAGRGR